MATISYQYIEAGVPKTVNVTFNFTGACNISSNFFQQPCWQQGLKIIVVTLEESIGIDLPIYATVDVDVTRDDGITNFTSYQQLGVIPAGSTVGEYTVECYRNTTYGADPCAFTEREIISYTYFPGAQPEIPEDGVPPLSAIVSSSSNVSCFGRSDGFIQVAAAGGTGNYSYVWTGPVAIGNSSLANALPAGIYSVTVSDGESSVVIENIELTQPSQIQAEITLINVTCWGGSNGSIALLVNGGSGAGFTFEWSDGSTLQNRSGLSAGNYTVVVTDSTGCFRNFSVTINQPSRIAIISNIEGNNVINTVSGGTPPYTYLWSDNIILKDRSDLPVGDYTFTVFDANGCSRSVIIVIDDFKFYFSKNNIFLSLPPQDVSGKPNLSYVCEVFLEEEYNTENYVKLISSEQPARVDGSTDFDMREVLNAYLRANVPQKGETQVLRVDERFKRFYLQSFEKFGNPPVPSNITQQDVFFVLFGGLSDQEFAKRVFFESYLDDKKPFLTWQPSTIEVTDDQDIYLNHVVLSSRAIIVLFADVRFKNAGLIQNIAIKEIQNAEPYEVYQFPCGVDQTNIKTFSSDDEIISYEVYLKTSGDVFLSEKKTFKVLKNKPHYKKFLYLNSLGAWDTILTKGRGNTRITSQEEIIDRTLPPDAAYETREDLVVTKTGTYSRRVVIDNLGGRQRQHLIDLAVSEQVYEQTRSGYLPVKVKLDFTPDDDFENFEEVSMNVEYPKVRRYTPEL
jgi:hypothetical protein